MRFEKANFEISEGIDKLESHFTYTVFNLSENLKEMVTVKKSKFLYSKEEIILGELQNKSQNQSFYLQNINSMTDFKNQ